MDITHIIFLIVVWFVIIATTSWAISPSFLSREGGKTELAPIIFPIAVLLWPLSLLLAPFSPDWSLDTSSKQDEQKAKNQLLFAVSAPILLLLGIISPFHQDIRSALFCAATALASFVNIIALVTLLRMYA